MAHEVVPSHCPPRERGGGTFTLASSVELCQLKDDPWESRANLQLSTSNRRSAAVWPQLIRGGQSSRSDIVGVAGDLGEGRGTMECRITKLRDTNEATVERIATLHRQLDQATTERRRSDLHFKSNRSARSSGSTCCAANWLWRNGNWPLSGRKSALVGGGCCAMVPSTSRRQEICSHGTCPKGHLYGARSPQVTITRHLCDRKKRII